MSTLPVAAGLVRDGDELQLTDELIGQVVEAVRPSRPDGRGDTWTACRASTTASPAGLGTG